MVIYCDLLRESQPNCASVVISSRDNPEVVLTSQCSRQYYLLRAYDSKLLCSVKKGDFVIQFFSTPIDDIVLNDSKRKSIVLGSDGETIGTLHLSVFTIAPKDNPANRHFTKMHLECISQRNATEGESQQGVGKEFMGCRLWLHLMDGLGYTGRNKCNMVARFEIIEKRPAGAGQNISGLKLPESFSEDKSVNVASVTSNCSVHARHLVWDQKMEMKFPSGVMQVVAKGLMNKSSGIINSTSTDLQYFLRGTMWLKNTTSAGCDAILVAVGERNIAELFAPFLHKTRGGVMGPVLNSPIRHEIVFPLRPLRSSSVEAGMSTACQEANDVRLRVGILLFSTDTFQHTKSNSISPDKNPRMKSENHGSLASAAELFMNRKGIVST